MNGFQRALFRFGTKVNNAAYRRSGGRLMNKAKDGIPVLLLTVAGRKTGTPHTNPVGYLEQDGFYVVVGSAGGDSAEPQWFRNLRATDHASVVVGPRHEEVTARVATGEERDRLFAQVVAKYPGFGEYEKKSRGRPMPVAVLAPVPTT